LLSGKSVLVTGGTGSFGQAFVAAVLDRWPSVRRLIVLSRDELKQFEMQQRLDPREHPQLRYFIGDVRDEPRLRSAFEGVDYVVHAAALKQVPTAEYNPLECIKTNVIGAENVISAALAQQVKKVIALSTDKAAAPVNLYGATKLCSDKLFVAANNIRGSREITFSVVRYGNVMGSRGSVIPYFLQRRHTGVLPITHPDMTRFNITLRQGVEMVLDALLCSLGGEIIVPKIPSYRITSLAEAIGPDCALDVIGIRPGEKLHEEMITVSDAPSTIETDDQYIIVPTPPFASPETSLQKYARFHRGRPVPTPFSYSSATNDQWLDVDQLRSLIREHVDPAFTVAETVCAK
jgi:UDP-N-acetylglucosamine 4,6-dehydratase (inverting)